MNLFFGGRTLLVPSKTKQKKYERFTSKTKFKSRIRYYTTNDHDEKGLQKKKSSDIPMNHFVQDANLLEAISKYQIEEKLDTIFINAIFRYFIASNMHKELIDSFLMFYRAKDMDYIEKDIVFCLLNAVHVLMEEKGYNLNGETGSNDSFLISEEAVLGDSFTRKDIDTIYLAFSLILSMKELNDKIFFVHRDIIFDMVLMHLEMENDELAEVIYLNYKSKSKKKLENAVDKYLFDHFDGKGCFTPKNLAQHAINVIVNAEIIYEIDDHNLFFKSAMHIDTSDKNTRRVKCLKSEIDKVDFSSPSIEFPKSVGDIIQETKVVIDDKIYEEKHLEEKAKDEFPDGFLFLGSVILNALVLSTIIG